MRPKRVVVAEGVEAADGNGCGVAAGGNDCEAADGKNCVAADGDNCVVADDEGEALVEAGNVTGADISGGKEGFNLSIETVQGFPAFKTVKVFSFLSRTSKGPM